MSSCSVENERTSALCSFMRLPGVQKLGRWRSGFFTFSLSLDLEILYGPNQTLGCAQALCFLFLMIIREPEALPTFFFGGE